jgi:hypothetical protein
VTNLNFLRIPLMMLSEMTDIDAFRGLQAENAARFSEEYSPQEQAGIRESLSVALSQKDFDFQPYMPLDSGFSNTQARAFLTKVAASIPE